ncbi:MAG: alpha/beta fold hydrolase [Myxococcales bacterium]|nr:alpha/beta fold hydrolase [Myxococcales bacterium]
MSEETESHESDAGPAYRVESVAVDGGALAVAQWGRRGPVILAIHGLTASHREFVALADALGDDVRMIAPDLRGRGRSNQVPGPWGMRAHAADMVAVLEHFGVDRADAVLGHSMGAFVAAVLAADHPERCGAVVMVDGGLPIAPVIPLHRLPFGDWMIAKLVQRVLGPALDRLEMTFASREAYRDYWREHPALGTDWSAYIEDYLDYDLVGEAPSLRAATSRAALMSDIRAQLFENIVPAALRRLRGPVRLLRAPRGLKDDKPLYTPAKLAKAGRSIAGFSFADVDDVNHYTIMISKRGAEAVAREVRALLGAGD